MRHPKPRLDRRRFLQESLLAAAATVVVPGAGASALAREQARRASPNEVIRVGVLGVRGRGRGHIGAFKKSPDAEVVAICDPDSAVIGDAMEAVPDATYYTDLRRLLDDPTIDAVSIATPNDWQALATIWALQAGKHVYVEKPISHDVHEGRAVVNAAHKYGLIVAHGTQARSTEATSQAMEWLRAGGLGRVSLAHGLCYKPRESIGKVSGPTTPPETIDMHLWTGPAALEPIMRENLHYDWHWVWNSGNGDIGNQGVHQMDIARWGLGLDRMPKAVQSCGGRLGYDDDGTTPNTLVTSFDYGDRQVLFEVRGLPTPGYRDTNIGVVFHGEHGYLVSASYSKVVVFDHDGEVTRTFTGDGNHFQNFLDAIRSGRAEDLTASALDGHLSSAMCHLGNVSYRTGSPRRLGEIADPFGTPYANERFDRFREHLAENGVATDTVECVSGPALAFDADRERFVGEHASKANALLRRQEPRPPFVIPDDLA